MRRQREKGSQKRDARIHVSDRAQLASNAASTSGEDLSCPANAIRKPMSDQPFRRCDGIACALRYRTAVRERVSRSQ